MKLRIGKQLPVDENTQVSLSLLIPYDNLEEYKKQAPMRVQGVVKWQRVEGDQTFCGIEFVKIGITERTDLQRCFDFFSHASTYR